MYACVYVPLNIRVKMPKRLDAAISQNESRKMMCVVMMMVFSCQVYDEDDYRRARFTGRQKEVRI